MDPKADKHTSLASYDLSPSACFRGMLATFVGMYIIRVQARYVRTEGVILGLYRDNRKEHGNYYLGS